MRVLESWVSDPLAEFLRESGARLTLVMTSSGQVIAQHGFTRSVDVMSAAALGAGILATTGEIARMLNVTDGFGAVVHQGDRQGVWLAGFDTPRGRWIALVVFGQESSLGLVRLFFARFAQQIRAAAPALIPVRDVLAEGFEIELDSSLRALFGSR
jgi:predicted regulator of Ras-like GTPase activity (Roadblock/LC7/MglB family)